MSVLLSILGCTLVPTLAACRPSGGSVERADARPLMVVVSGDTRGWIMPCGCAANQSGGLARRGTYLDRARQQGDVIVADVGGAAGGASRYDRVKFAAILRGEVAMGLSAHNLGETEIRLGADELRRLASETGVPFVSANVLDVDGKAIAERLRIVTAGRRRIALVGVASERYATETVRVTDPAAAIVAALAAVQGKCDAVIVLAYAETKELTALAEHLPEVDMVVGGPTLQSLPPRLVGPKTLLASVTNKGKFLARFDAPPLGATEPWHGEIVEVESKLPDDGAQVANLAQYRSELERLDLPATDSGLVSALESAAQAGYEIASSETCRACHQRDAEVWEHSRHAEAWQTLVDRGWHVDSLCQQCHTTGFGLPGGFLSAGRSQSRGAVGCESCHGPSAAHAAQPKKHRTTFAARDGCVQCHDRENSPTFVQVTYWEKIGHGAHSGAEEESAGATPQ